MARPATRRSMKPFERILAPIDFAQHSVEAVHRAIDIARHYSASITLAYVYEPAEYALPEGYVLYSQDQLTQLTSELEQRLDAARREVLAAGFARADARLLTGSAAGEIVDFAKSGEFDLIVMGTHGRKGLSHVLMGSVAERVLRLAHCAVMVVKAAEPSAQGV